MCYLLTTKAVSCDLLVHVTVKDLLVCTRENYLMTSNWRHCCCRHHNFIMYRVCWLVYFGFFSLFFKCG